MTDAPNPQTTIPADILAAVNASDYPGEASERLAAARAISFSEAYKLVCHWQERALDAQ